MILRKNNLPGGILLCVFPAVVLVVLHLQGQGLRMPFPILFALFFLYGFRVVVWSLFELDFDGAVSWVIDALGAAGFALFAFWIAIKETEGWGGGVPLVPDRWNQNLARLLFGFGGIIAALFAIRCLRKAVNRSRNRPDGGIRHVQ